MGCFPNLAVVLKHLHPRVCSVCMHVHVCACVCACVCGVCVGGVLRCPFLETSASARPCVQCACSACVFVHVSVDCLCVCMLCLCVCVRCMCANPIIITKSNKNNI